MEPHSPHRGMLAVTLATTGSPTAQHAPASSSGSSTPVGTSMSSSSSGISCMLARVTARRRGGVSGDAGGGDGCDCTGGGTGLNDRVCVGLSEASLSPSLCTVPRGSSRICGEAASSRLAKCFVRSDFQSDPDGVGWILEREPSRERSASRCTLSREEAESRRRLLPAPLADEAAETGRFSSGRMKSGRSAQFL